MAEEEAAAGGGGGGAPEEAQGDHKCEECVEGLPMWMGTFSDLVTLLMTFFVLLLSFAKTETDKYKAALGSIRKAFGGNTMKYGEVLQPGKSPDDAPTMIDAQEPVKPFPIDFLTSEGLLDKKEINRESTETLESIRRGLKDAELADDAQVYELSEGIKVKINEKIYFKPGTTSINQISVRVFERVVKLLKQENMKIFIEAHSKLGERSGKMDALELSAKRATVVQKVLVKRGVPAENISSVFYGSTRPLVRGQAQDKDARVEFLLRKVDLSNHLRKVPTR